MTTRSILIIALITAVGVRELRSQYFGRNKVQYESFDFKVMRTDHFDIYFYPEAEEPVRDAARMVERWYARLSQLFNHKFSERKSIILYANHADFQQTNVIGGQLSEGTGGVTEGLKDRVIIPLTGISSDNDHVIGHELVHVFQYDMAKTRLAGLRGLSQLPLWLVEGMAEYLSVGRNDPHTAMWMRDAVLHNDLPTIDDLGSDPKYFPYRFGQALWAYIGGRWGDTTVPALFNRAQVVGFNPALDTLIGMDEDSLSTVWANALRETYQGYAQASQKPSDVGKPILTEEMDAGEVNLSPSISPDGKYVAFLSERSVFAIDLFIADAKTGEVITQLTSSSTDTHIDALSFINSAGTWSPDGKKFAMITFEEGDNRIAIIDIDSRKVERDIKLERVNGIANLAWSPDGHWIAISGTAGGKSDLYLYNLDSKKIRQLTNDLYADLQPAWSPDGSHLAFVTDRGEGTGFDNLTYSPMLLGILNVSTGTLETVTPFNGARHSNPQYSPDGQSLYFLSERGGVSNLYRLNLSTNEVAQLTRLATGISGLTYISPAMSVAQKSGDIVFNIFEKRAYNVYIVTNDQINNGMQVVANVENEREVGILPPIEETPPRLVGSYLHDAKTGLPDRRQFPVEDYSPSLGLIGVGQATIGVGADRFGSSIGGGVSFAFSDLLGNRNLGVIVQSNGDFQDIGGQVSYINVGNRFNWGVALSRIPYLTGFTRLSTTSTTRIYEQELQRTYLNQAVFLSQYPLSPTHRFEFTAGYTRVGYDVEVERITTTLSGLVIGDETFDQAAPPGLNLIQASAAFVGDYSVFGFTSPVNGGRYRLEVQPTGGSLQYVSALADYRRYFFVNPFTVAFRGMYYGRYGGSAEDELLTPVYLGYGTLVRGYDANSFNANECTEAPGEASTCIEFDRLVGSSISVANVELRIPVFGNENFGLINFPYLPLELSGFFDGGVAWNKGNRVELKFDVHSHERVPVFSTGVSGRVNVLGFLVVEVYYVHPFQRPVKGNHWGFQIAPGW